MNKKLLGVAVVAALASGAAQAVDIDAGTGTASFATEITTSAATTLTNAANIMDVTKNAGFSISDSTARYMRFDLTGGVFGAIPTLAVADSGAGANEVLSTGGAVDGNFVVFEVTASAGNTVGVADDAVLAAASYKVTDKTGINVTYRLYDNATDAVNNTTANALVTGSGAIASFTAATSVAATSVTPLQIDVTSNSVEFVGSVATNIVGELALADTAGNQWAIDGATDATIANTRTAGVLTVTGDFTATQDLTAGAPDGTYTVSNAFLDNDGDATNCNTASINATTLTDTTATFALGNAAIASSKVCITTNGVSAIPEATYTATYAPTVAAGYTIADVALTLGTLSKNGSSTALDLLLTPGGAFANYVRVTNKSSIAGDVFITLYNDDGDSVTIDLGDVAGVTGNSLAAQASSKLMAISDIYAAAQAADATFMVTGASTKLRAVIEGEFSSISAQNVSVATDGTAFSTF